MAAAVAELRPGVHERELTGVFMDAMASRGVTTPATQDVVHITSADRVDGLVQAGDLVAFDAGVVADGYAGEVGRTWPVDRGGGTTALPTTCTAAGTTCGRGCSTPASPARPRAGCSRPTGAPANRSRLLPVGRGLGLGFDDPVVVRDLPETAAQETLDPGVVLVVTGCVFDDTAGAVIAHEPVLITPDGPEVLSSSPFWNPEPAGALA